MMDCPVYNVIEYLPADFLSKTVNEPFIQMLMSRVFPDTRWVPGNPDKFEPDYFCSGTPFEFTLASDCKRKNNFIQKIRQKTYSTADADTDVIAFIRQRISDKASKKYKVPNVHLCVLCLLDMTGWVLDKYGSVTQPISDWSRQEFFDEIGTTYIASGIFSNIFILFPDMFARWWIWDLRTDKRISIQLEDSDLKSGAYPYCLCKDHN